MDDKILFLYAQGMSTRGIATTIKEMYGVDIEGHKELLGLWISENEGAKFWLNVLTELQNRGVKDILIACVDGLKGFPIKNTYSTPRGRAGPGGKSPQKSLSVAVEYIPDVRKDYKETLDEARARITGEFQGKPYHEWRRRALVFYILEAGGPEGRTVRQLCDGANALLEISPEAAAAHEREKDKENQNQNRTMNKENSNNKDDDGDGGDPTTTTTSTKDGPTPWIPRSVSTSLLMGEEAFCRVGKGLWALRAMPGVKAVKPLQTLGGAPVQSAKDKQQKEREEKEK